jgi:uncharacterized damage-inducible protein DinB
VEGFLRHYAFVNDTILRLIDHVPDERHDWAPAPEMWSFRQLFVHIANGRDVWLHGLGEEVTPAVDARLDLDAIAQMIGDSWQRLVTFARDPAKMAATYDFGRRGVLSGEDVVTSRLVHDVHHRAEILSYLAQLGVPATEVEGFERYGPQPDPLTVRTP